MKKHKDEWNSAAQTFSTPHIRKSHIRMPAFIKALGNVANKKVLDLGCGDGYYARIIAKKGAQVTAVDFSKNLIDIGARAEEKKPQGIAYYVSDVTKMAFLKNNTFDKAVADMVFVITPTQKKYIKQIKEVYRILKKGGEIIVSKGHPTGFNRPGTSKKYAVSYDGDVSYFDSLTPQHVELIIDGQKAQWTNYHRTLMDFINPWIENGFVVSKIIEPKPTQSDVAKYPEYLAGTDKRPHVIMVVFKKI